MTDASLAPLPAPDPAERRRDRLWLAGVLAGALLLTLVAAHWTLAMWSFTLDQILFRSTAAWVPHALPGSLWDLATYQRGTQRLSEWIQAVTLGVFGSPTGFRVGRWIFVLSYASTVAPVWLLARRAGADRAWATVGALMAVLVPWAIVSGTFLTEPLAYPLFAWAMLACWGSAVHGGWRWDLLALVAIGAAALARTGMVLLVVVLAVAVVGVELRVTLAERSWRELPRGFARRHGLLLAAAVFGALLAAGGLASKLRGSWYSNTSPRLSALEDGLIYVISVLGPGLAFAGAVAGFAFALSRLVKPLSREQLALGMVVLGALAMMLLTMITGPSEERYLFYLAAPVAAAFAAGAARRSISWWAIAAAGALLLWTLDRRIWWPGDPDYSRFLLFPSETWVTRVVRLGVASRLPGNVSADTAMNLVIVGGVVLAGLLASPLPRGWGTRPAVRAVSLAVAVLLVAAGGVQAGWVLHKYRATGGGGQSPETRAWVDDLAGGKTVGLWLPPAPTGLDQSPWQEVRYYNLDVKQQVRVGTSQDAPGFPADDPVVTAQIDPATGRLVLPPGERLPAYVVVSPDRDSAPLRGRVVKDGPNWDLKLVAPSTPAAVRWQTTAGPADGRLPAGRALVYRVFRPAGPAPACLALTVTGNNLGPATVTATGGGGVARVRVGAGRTAALLAPLGPGRATDVRVVARGPVERAPNVSPVTAQVRAVTTRRCR